MVSPIVNVNNIHDVAPITSSKVGPVRGCGGPPNSPEALEQEGVFRMASTGGKSRRRGKRPRSLRRRRHYTKKRVRRGKREHQRGGQLIIEDRENIGLTGTPMISDTNIASREYPMRTIGGKSRRRRSSRRYRKSKKHSRKHRRRSGRRMRGGDGVYAAALTPSYSMPGEAESSALASPPPIVRTNNCLDTWKHIGDKPPYNEEWKGIN